MFQRLSAATTKPGTSHPFLDFPPGQKEHSRAYRDPSGGEIDIASLPT